MMTVQTEIVNLTTATTSLLNEVITKKSVLDAAEGIATAALDATNINVAAAKASEIAAKTSETNANAAAAQARQISGLSTVAEAIGMAALPLPDVWAPLSDSLRLITGYGRDVLVGSDVVARMVNFSRNSTATYIGKDGQLKTAAANEPRFEKEGLLIEGQSTNLFPWSQEFIGKWLRVDGVASPDVNFPNAISLNDSGIGYVHTSIGNLNGGSPYSILAIVKGYVDGSTGIRGIFANGGQDSSKVVGRYGPYTVLSFVRNAAVNTNASVTGLSWDPGKATGIVLCALQIEALPFSSSYIPTNGAAVTRAMDKALIPVKMNEATMVQTCAIEINIPLVNISAYRWILQGSYVSLSITDASRIRGWDFAASIGAGPTRAGRSVIAQRITDTSRSVFNNGGGFTVSNTGVTGAYFPHSTSDLAIGWHVGTYALYGHVRNLRIWHRDLSDTQIKAIA